MSAVISSIIRIILCQADLKMVLIFRDQIKNFRLVAIELEVLVLNYVRVFAADTIGTVFSSVTFNSLFINSSHIVSLPSYILTVSSVSVRLCSVCVVYDFKRKW
uniref:Uncharacterized protein n=1 Tax=Glossina pallidipes TaxID=7398 RepID=A0A1A9Z4K9_GLOPL